MSFESTVDDYYKNIRYSLNNIYAISILQKQFNMGSYGKSRWEAKTFVHLLNVSKIWIILRKSKITTGEFRGAKHSLCNITYQMPSFIPVVFHNLPDYDSHLFIKKLACKSRQDIGCIPMNEEKYIGISSHVIVDEYEKRDKKTDEMKKIKVTQDLPFIDSLKFMSSRLAL